MVSKAANIVYSVKIDILLQENVEYVQKDDETTT